MANRKRAEARRKAQAKAARSTGEGGGSGKGLMWAAIAVVIAIAAGIGIYAASGDDEAATDNTETTSGSNLPDSQPAEITGEPLAAFAEGADPMVGADAPVVSGLNFSGKEVVLDAKATGRPYMVVFLAHWCPHCNAEVPRLNDWKHSGAVPADLDVIGVATAVAESQPNYPPAEWFSNKGWEWPVLVDEADGEGAAGKVAQAFGASGWPYFVIVGADGKVKVRYSGEIEVSELQSIVDQALAS